MPSRSSRFSDGGRGPAWVDASSFFRWSRASRPRTWCDGFTSRKEKLAMANPNGRAVFLDRDGTIIFDHGYLKEAREVRLLAGAGEALATIQQHGFALVLIS